MSDAHSQGIALPFRVYGLEGMVKTLDEASTHQRETSARLSEAVGAQGVTLAKHEVTLAVAKEDVDDVKTDVVALAASVNKLSEKLATSTTRVAWALVGFAFTVAGSTASLVLTRPGAW